MRKWFFLWICTFSLGLCLGQEVNCKSAIEEPSLNIELERFINSSNLEDQNKLIQKFEQTIDQLEKIKSRKSTDYAFLRAVFYKTHSAILKDYDRLATMDQTLAYGKFGCLTGTAIYALILDHFGYEYNIIELPNHVFIYMTVEGDSYVYESTLPMDGFRRTNAEMQNLLKQPWINHRRIGELNIVGDWFDEKSSLPGYYSIINLEKLAGLQYFNESVKSYLKKDYISAMELVFMAYDLYPSEKNEKLMQLIINKILKYEMIKEEMRNQYLKQYVRLVKPQKLYQNK